MKSPTRSRSQRRASAAVVETHQACAGTSRSSSWSWQLCGISKILASYTIVLVLVTSCCVLVAQCCSLQDDLLARARWQRRLRGSCSNWSRTKESKSLFNRSYWHSAPYCSWTGIAGSHDATKCGHARRNRRSDYSTKRRGRVAARALAGQLTEPGRRNTSIDVLQLRASRQKLAQCAH
jgi:hypothetical protein